MTKAGSCFPGGVTQALITLLGLAVERKGPEGL